MKKTNMTFQFFKRFVLFAGVYASLAGTVVADTPATPSTLRTISISSNVWITVTPSYEPYKGDAPQSTKDALKALVESNDINLRNIVLKTFRTRLEKDVPLAIVATNADADLQIHIEDYGLSARNKTLMQPTITIEARLIKTNGHVIWNGGENISDSEFEGISAHTWQEYTTNPSLLKTGYEEVANSAVNTIANKLVENHKAGEIGE